MILKSQKVMTHIPQDIKEVFYKTIKGDISLSDFEQWLYVNKDLEKHLNSDDYLDLISLNFNKSGAKYELWKLLKNHIDLGEFETYKMIELLSQAQHKTDKLPYILMDFYDLYCKGYIFLQDLGLGFGLAVEVPRVNNSMANSWEELTPEQQKELIESFSPELEASIEQVVDLLKTKKIILTGEQDEIGHYNYQDLRTEEEMEPKLFVRASVEDSKKATVNKGHLLHNQNQKKWWEFWK